jgi:hypothetical protein
MTQKNKQKANKLDISMEHILSLEANRFLSDITAITKARHLSLSLTR